MANALQYGKNQALSQAQLSAFGANQLGNNINLSRNASRLGGIGTSSAQSSNLYGLELDAANRAGDSQKSLADQFTLLSHVGNLAAGSGVPQTRNALGTFGPIGGTAANPWYG
jgi:hypothetical protein